ncbi:hypothetical protein GCM10023193_68080 [Planotetraspora kaengkrachanensis]|uniref:MFS transporter n=2 Tax=Planotetraspora kaengkrachanensis TaxID=575193 RepID=A0A8J3VAI2_9ACTN|nr:hypothetical protein Pka01_64480 [Planotetraspora kaengkrachanensis]
MLGTRTLGVAYPLLALALTGSAAEVGWVGFILTVPSLVMYLPAGVVADRFSPRIVMLVSEGARGIAAFSVFAAMAWAELGVTHLKIAAFVEGATWVMYAVAETALIRSIAPGTPPDRALTGSETASHVAVLTGRPLGGLLFGLGKGIPFITNAIFFATSFVALLFIREPRSRRRSEFTRESLGSRRPAFWREVGQGISELWNNEFLRQAMGVTAATNLMVNALIMVFLASSADLSPVEVGLVLAAGGLSGSVGSGIASRVFRWKPSLQRFPLLFAQVWIWVIALLVAALAPRPYSFGLATLLTGVTGSISNMAIRTEEMSNVREDLVARVMSIHRLVVHGVVCLAAPLGGLLVTRFGPAQATVILMAAMLFVAVCATLAWLVRGRRLSGVRSLPHKSRPPLKTSLRIGLDLEMVDALKTKQIENSRQSVLV